MSNNGFFDDIEDIELPVSKLLIILANLTKLTYELNFLII